MKNGTTFGIIAVLAAGLCGDVVGQLAPRTSALAPAPLLLHDAYDPDNPFARIIRGELPAAKVYEDKYVLAFMDRAPVAPGHVLVISKISRARNLLDEDPEDYARLMAVVQRVAQAQITALGASGFTIIENNGAGQTVPHLHIHVIPRMSAWPLVLGIDKRADPKELEAMAAKIRAAMK